MAAATETLSDAEYRRLFFKWAHPQIADYCHQHQLQYPAMRNDGEVANPSAWYDSVRAGTAGKLSPEEVEHFKRIQLPTQL